ncbi:hypothetical protein P9112_014355 [Eukaryota sp. TZLM1-RC]
MDHILSKASSITPYLDRAIALRLVDFLIERNCQPLKDLYLSRLQLVVDAMNLEQIRLTLLQLHFLEVSSPITLNDKTVEFSVATGTPSFSLNSKSEEELASDLEAQKDNLLMELSLNAEDLDGELSADKVTAIESHPREALNLSRFYYNQQFFDISKKLLSPLLSTTSVHSDALWGLLAIAIIEGHHDQATELAQQVRECIEEEAKKRSAGHNITLRATLLHWLLPVFVDSPDLLADFLFKSSKDIKYVTAVSNIAPHLLDYCFMVFCTKGSSEIHSRSFELLKLLNNCSMGPECGIVFESPVVQFLSALSECDLEKSGQYLAGLKQIFEGDYFVSKKAGEIFRCCVELVIDLYSRVVKTVSVEEISEISGLDHSESEVLITKMLLDQDCEVKEGNFHINVSSDPNLASSIFNFVGLENIA